MKKVILSLVFLVGLGISVSAQCPKVMPVGTLCISQEAANRAAQLVRENAAQADKIVILENSLKEKDKNEAELRKTAADNESALKQQLIKTQTDLATETGRIIECRADKVMYTSLIEFLAKNQKSKQNGVLNIRLGGN